MAIKSMSSGRGEPTLEGGQFPPQSLLADRLLVGQYLHDSQGLFLAEPQCLLQVLIGLHILQLPFPGPDLSVSRGIEIILFPHLAL